MPQTLLKVYNPINNNEIDFQSNSNIFYTQFPIDIDLNLPENTSVGEDIFIPINIKNLNSESSFNGTIQLDFINSEGIIVYNLSTTISLHPSETQLINMIASPGISAGIYLMNSTLQVTNASMNIFKSLIYIDAGQVMGYAYLENKYSHKGINVTLGNFETMTYPDGSYLFEGVPKGQYSLNISYPGYSDYSDEVIIDEGFNIIPKVFLMNPFGSPAGVKNLTNITFTQTYINFTWTNPPDPDYHHVMLFLNGTFITNITAPQNYFNVTGLISNTEYELGTHTVDSSGNVNETWVNATARTQPSGAMPPVAVCGADKFTCENIGAKVQFNATGSYDLDGTILSYGWEFGDGTTGTGVAPNHTYTAYRWNGSVYQPFIVNLTVKDESGLTNRTSQNVTIWIAGDANGDGKVNILDASVVGLKWNGNDPCADLNNDGKVNILDASIIGLNWGKSASVQ